MLSLRIEMLGPLQVKVGGKTAVFRTDAERVLLAYLAAHQGRAQRRDTLAGLLAPDRPDAEALTYLRNRLTRLRGVVRDGQANPAWLAIDRKQITLRTGDDMEVDVTRFERLLVAVESHAHRQLAGCPTCLARLEEAVGLVRGEFLAGLNFPSETWETWLLAQREHVGQRALAAMTWLREAWWERGELTAVLHIAQRQLQLEPWLEAAHRAIMQTHYALGDRNAALAQFEQCQTILWDELGVEPENETIRLFETIQSGSPPSSFIIPNSSFPHNLPLPTGLFVGRETEQAQLLQRLVDPAYRLITLVGTGGIGKTRLAVEVGQQVQASFPDGVWFVPLAGEAEQIKMAVGEAMGLGQGEKQLTGEQVLAILRDKQLLLILDNCETVLDELGFIPEWLRRAPQVAILATSREPLNFQAESVLLLSGLPSGTAEALFAERGKMARDDFAISNDNFPQVQQICQLVDGSPLGIGLAAAWVRRRLLGQIVGEIGRSLDFLSTRLRDVDPRHRSVRAVFETSWQLLEPEEQTILAALSVFPASFTAVAAAQITGATLFALDLLCEKSLLQQQHERERYAMHSLVRQFAAEKLGVGKTAVDANAVDHEFLDYYYLFAARNQHNYDALQPEWRNFAAGIRKAHALAAWQQLLDFVHILDEPWFRQIRFSDMQEGLRLALDAAVQLQAPSAIAQILLRLGEIEMELNDYDMAEVHLAKAMSQMLHLEDSLGIGQVMFLNGRLKYEQSQDDEAQQLFTESKRLCAEQEDWLGVAKNLNYIALCHMKKEPNYEIATAYLEQSVALLRHLPASATYVEALRHLARIKSRHEAYQQAEAYLDEAADMTRQQKDLGEYAAVLYEQMVLSKRCNQLDKALVLGYEALDYFYRLGSLRWEALVKTQLGLLHQAQKQPDQALPLFRDGLKIFVEIGDLFEQAYSYFYLHKLNVELGETAQSQAARQQAEKLAFALPIPHLQKELALAAA